MVGEEEKANSHTSSSFCLGSPQGCNCFPSSHLCLFFVLLLLACLFLVIHSGRTDVALAPLSSLSVIHVISVSLPRYPPFSVTACVCVCVHLLYAHVTCPAGTYHIPERKWKQEMKHDCLRECPCI